MFNKRYLYLGLLVISILTASCSPNESSEDYSYVKADESIKGLSNFITKSKPIVIKTCNEFKSYHPNATRAFVQEDSLDIYARNIANETELFLVENQVSTDSIGNEYKLQVLSTLGLALIEQERNSSTNQTRSIGGCAAYAIGIRDILKRGLTSKAGLRFAVKTLTKNIAKKAIPYVGWGLTFGEFAYCMYHDGDV